MISAFYNMYFKYFKYFSQAFFVWWFIAFFSLNILNSTNFFVVFQISHCNENLATLITQGVIYACARFLSRFRLSSRSKLRLQTSYSTLPKFKSKYTARLKSDQINIFGSDFFCFSSELFWHKVI